MARRINSRSVGRVRDTGGRVRPSEHLDGIDHGDAHLEDWRSVRRRAAHIGRGRDRASIDLGAKLMLKLVEKPAVRQDVVREARAAVKAGDLDCPAKLDAALDRMIADLLG